MTFVTNIRALVLAATIAGSILPAAASCDPAGITVNCGANPGVALTSGQLAGLPTVQLTLPATGGTPETFQGPLLWAVLGIAHALPAKPHMAVSLAVLVTGSDRYAALLAMGEIAPFLEAKQVILADQMNGKPLGTGHWRLVIPGEAKRARNVRDIVQIAVVAPHGP